MNIQLEALYQLVKKKAMELRNILGLGSHELVYKDWNSAVNEARQSISAVKLETGLLLASEIHPVWVMRNGNIEWGNDSFLRLFELTPEILREAFPQSADFSGVWLLELFSPSKEAISKLVSLNITGELLEPRAHSSMCQAISYRSRKIIPGVLSCRIFSLPRDSPGPPPELLFSRSYSHGEPHCKAAPAVGRRWLFQFIPYVFPSLSTMTEHLAENSVQRTEQVVHSRVLEAVTSSRVTSGTSSSSSGSH